MGHGSSLKDFYSEEGLNLNAVRGRPEGAPNKHLFHWAKKKKVRGNPDIIDS